MVIVMFRVAFAVNIAAATAATIIIVAGTRIVTATAHSVGRPSGLGVGG